MVTPNSQLEAALAQFVAQLGTTPDQEAQLRAAVVADADRLDLLNQQAAWLTRTVKQRVTTLPRANLLALLCALAIPACATTPKPIPPTKEVSAMATSQSASATSNPNLTAEEIGKRFLKLIGGLESRNDLNVDLVRKTLGLQLSPAPWDKHHFISDATIGSDWSYVAGFLEETPSNLKSVYLDFRNAKARFADMTPVCSLDFDSYHDALVTMGFRPVEIRGEIGKLESWRYYKNDFAMEIVPQNVVSGEAGRLCAKSIGMLNGR